MLSKARKRWGKEVFEKLFVRTVGQCVEAGLGDGSKLHVDSSLIEADAARDSGLKGPPPLIAALKAAYQATASKLAESQTTHRGDAASRQHNARSQGIFPDTAFSYDVRPRSLSLSRGRDAAAAPLASYPPPRGIYRREGSVRGLSAAEPMHAGH